MKKMKEFQISSVSAGFYGDKRATLNKEQRREIFTKPSAFIQLNLGTIEGKPVSLRAKASVFGATTLATIEKNLNSGSKIIFNEEVEVHEVSYDRDDGSKVTSFSVIGDLVKDGKLNFAVVSSGPKISLPEGWVEEEDIEVDHSYSVRKNRFGEDLDVNANVEDKSKTLGALAGL